MGYVPNLVIEVAEREKSSMVRPGGSEWRSLRGEGGSVRIEPLRQLLDDCTSKRNSKRKVGKPMYN